MTTGSLILESYLQTFEIDKMNKLRRKKMVSDLLEYNKKVGGDLLTPLSYYLSILENMDEVLLIYMSQEKKDAFLRDLQVTYLLLLAQKKYELTHQKYENTKLYDNHIANCQRLIDLLTYKKICEENNTVPAPDYGYGSDGKPEKYLGIFLGQWLAKKIVDMMDRTTKTIKEAMGWFNEKRLYWVWGSGFLKTVLDLLPPEFFNTTEAQIIVRTPDPYTGTLSWALYYFRFALNLFLLLKHTIKGPWMSETESKTPWTERFLTQWDQRKFTLLNDLVWATGNLVCFFWLTGKGLLGTWGDALTLGLLIFDVSLAIWDFAEQQTKHNKEMLNFEIEISIIHELIAKAKTASEEDKEEKKKLKEYQYQLAALERTRNQSQREWDYSKLKLKTNLAYAIGLMVAFALLTTPFLPITGTALVAIGVTGSVLCFAFSVIYNAVKGGIEIHKANMTKKEAHKDYKNKITEFHELVRNNPDLEGNEKKFLFLEIKKALAETQYQKQMVVLQTMHLFRSIIMETLIPALIFASLVFLPLGIGFAVLGAGLALAFVSNIVINKIFTPKKEAITTFNENEYQAFCNDPDHWDKKSTKTKHGFFKSPEKQADKIKDTVSLADASIQDDLEETFIKF